MARELSPLPKVPVGRHSSWASSVESYRSLVSDDLVDEICALGKDLRGLKVCQVNATAAGGGVAELLSRLVPVYLAIGLATDWRLVYGDKEFFAATKSFHNALQGARLRLTSEAKQAYLKHNQISAEMLREDYDVFVVDDPQPAAHRTPRHLVHRVRLRSTMRLRRSSSAGLQHRTPRHLVHQARLRR